MKRFAIIKLEFVIGFMFVLCNIVCATVRAADAGEGPMAAFRTFIPIAQKYFSSADEKALAEFRTYVFEADNPRTGGRVLSQLKKDIGNGTDEWNSLDIVDRHWEEDGLAVCVIVTVNALSKFPNPEAMLFVKDASTKRWLLVGARSDAVLCESLSSRMVVVDRLFKRYQEATREIKKPYFDKRERERARVRSGRGY